jgi:hypothetical protein
VILQAQRVALPEIILQSTDHSLYGGASDGNEAYLVRAPDCRNPLETGATLVSWKCLFARTFKLVVIASSLLKSVSVFFGGHRMKNQSGINNNQLESAHLLRVFKDGFQHCAGNQVPVASSPHNV